MDFKSINIETTQSVYPIKGLVYNPNLQLICVLRTTQHVEFYNYPTFFLLKRLDCCASALVHSLKLLDTYKTLLCLGDKLVVISLETLSIVAVHPTVSPIRSICTTSLRKAFIFFVGTELGSISLYEIPHAININSSNKKTLASLAIDLTPKLVASFESCITALAFNKKHSKHRLFVARGNLISCVSLPRITDDHDQSLMTQETHCFNLGCKSRRDTALIRTWSLQFCGRNSLVSGHSNGIVNFWNVVVMTSSAAMLLPTQQLRCHDADVLSVYVDVVGQRVFTGGVGNRITTLNWIDDANDEEADEKDNKGSDDAATTTKSAGKWVVGRHLMGHESDVTCLALATNWNRGGGKKRAGREVIVSGGADCQLIVHQLFAPADVEENRDAAGSVTRITSYKPTLKSCQIPDKTWKFGLKPYRHIHQAVPIWIRGGGGAQSQKMTQDVKETSPLRPICSLIVRHFERRIELFAIPVRRKILEQAEKQLHDGDTQNDDEESCCIINVASASTNNSSLLDERKERAMDTIDLDSMETRTTKSEWRAKKLRLAATATAGNSYAGVVGGGGQDGQSGGCGGAGGGDEQGGNIFFEHRKLDSLFEPFCVIKLANIYPHPIGGSRGGGNFDVDWARSITTCHVSACGKFLAYSDSHSTELLRLDFRVVMKSHKQQQQQKEEEDDRKYEKTHQQVGGGEKDDYQDGLSPIRLSISSFKGGQNRQRRAGRVRSSGMRCKLPPADIVHFVGGLTQCVEQQDVSPPLLILSPVIREQLDDSDDDDDDDDNNKEKKSEKKDKENEAGNLMLFDWRRSEEPEITKFHTPFLSSSSALSKTPYLIVDNAAAKMRQQQPRQNQEQKQSISVALAFLDGSLCIYSLESHSSISSKSSNVIIKLLLHQTPTRRKKRRNANLEDANNDDDGKNDSTNSNQSFVSAMNFDAIGQNLYVAYTSGQLHCLNMDELRGAASNEHDVPTMTVTLGEEEREKGVEKNVAQLDAHTHKRANTISMRRALKRFNSEFCLMFNANLLYSWTSLLKGSGRGVVNIFPIDSQRLFLLADCRMVVLDMKRNLPPKNSALFYTMQKNRKKIVEAARQKKHLYNHCFRWSNRFHRLIDIDLLVDGTPIAIYSSRESIKMEAPIQKKKFGF